MISETFPRHLFHCQNVGSNLYRQSTFFSMHLEMLVAVSLIFSRNKLTSLNTQMSISKNAGYSELDFFGKGKLFLNKNNFDCHKCQKIENPWLLLSTIFWLIDSYIWLFFYWNNITPWCKLENLWVIISTTTFGCFCEFFDWLIMKRALFFRTALQKCSNSNSKLNRSCVKKKLNFAMFWVDNQEVFMLRYKGNLLISN